MCKIFVDRALTEMLSRGVDIFWVFKKGMWDGILKHKVPNRSWVKREGGDDGTVIRG